MEASGTTDVPRFKILSQVHERDFSDPRDPGVMKWNVTFITESGDQASVYIPESAYTAENVAKEVLAKVTTMEAVRKLGTLP